MNFHSTPASRAPNLATYLFLSRSPFLRNEYKYDWSPGASRICIPQTRLLLRSRPRADFYPTYLIACRPSPADPSPSTCATPNRLSKARAHFSFLAENTQGPSTGGCARRCYRSRFENQAILDKMSTLEQMGIDMSRRNTRPRLLTDDERVRLDEFIDSIHYSTRCVPPSTTIVVSSAP